MFEYLKSRKCVSTFHPHIVTTWQQCMNKMRQFKLTPGRCILLRHMIYILYFSFGIHAIFCMIHTQAFIFYWSWFLSQFAHFQIDYSMLYSALIGPMSVKFFKPSHDKLKTTIKLSLAAYRLSYHAHNHKHKLSFSVSELLKNTNSMYFLISQTLLTTMTFTISDLIHIFPIPIFQFFFSI